MIGRIHVIDRKLHVLWHEICEAEKHEKKVQREYERADSRGERRFDNNLYLVLLEG